MSEPAPRPSRDLRLDFFRGLALFLIFIDHIPENVLSYFTMRAIAFNDAAEIFIFISGYTAALVYGRSLRERGAVFATAQIYRRVWQLYVAHIFLFVIFTAEVSYAIMVVRNPLYSEEMRVGDFLSEPHLAITRALLLEFQPAFLDILPLYIVLLGTFPIVLVLMARQRYLPLALSGGLYILTLSNGWALYTWPAHHVWFFNPLAWQFLFVIGATAGFERGSPAVPGGAWLGRAAVVFAAIIACINITWTLHWIYDPIPAVFAKYLWNHTIDKTNLAPLRLFSFVALAGATVHLIGRDNAFLRSRWAKPVIICGQQSLYIFCLGILLSVLGHFLLAEYYGGFVMQVAVNAVGASVMISVAAVLNWFKTAARRPRAIPSPPLSATPSE